MREVLLSRGYIAIVDDEDYDLVSGKVWTSKVTKGGVYAKTGKSEYLHRLIMQPPPGLEVDHIDRNPLNNRRSNMRLCTHAENCRNRRGGKGSEYHGVSWHKQGRKWQVHLAVKDFPRIYLGLFADKIQAAKAYDAAAAVHHGPFAMLNFPQENEK